MAEESIIIVDARGHRCPTPSLMLRKALASGPAGVLVRLLADDPMARIDAPLLVYETGHHLISVEEVNDVLSFTVRIIESAVGK